MYILISGNTESERIENERKAHIVYIILRITTVSLSSVICDLIGGDLMGDLTCDLDKRLVLFLLTKKF